MSGSTQKRRGRPPSPPGVSRNQRVVTFVTSGELDRIKQLADDNNLALSATVHQLIEQGLSMPEIATSLQAANHTRQKRD